MPYAAEKTVFRYAGQMKCSMNFNNISELAESWVAGTLSAAEVAEVKSRMAADSGFAIELNEHILLIESLNGSGSQKRFRAMLREIGSEQAVKAPKKRTIQLPAHFWRTSAVAASVALLTSFITYSFFISTTKHADSQYSTISREVDHIKRVQQKQQETQNAIIDSITHKKVQAPPPSDVRYTGTGFALTNDGYFVTAAHVINNGDFDSVYIQCNDDLYYKAYLVNYNSKADIAILKVEKKNFHFGKTDVPYSLKADKAGLGARIYTIGYPSDDMAYSEGYISRRNGYEGNNLQYTLELPAGHGQSGSPVMDEHGNMLGILTAISNPTEANTYAIGARSLTDLLQRMPPGNKLHLPKANRLSGLDRESQIEKMQDYTFSVKVYKK